MIDILHSYRALTIQPNDAKDTYLIVSDLHIGFEEKFRGAGVSFDSNAESMGKEISSLISSYRVTHLVINGDLKSSTDRISSAEWENIPRFFSKIPSSCPVTVIPGNHDGGLKHILPERVEISSPSGILIDNNLVMHGHTKPISKFSNCRRMIIGHLHPIYQEKGSPLSGQAVWVFLKLDRKKIFQDILDTDERDQLLDVLIMPSFNKDLAVAGYSREAAKQERKTAPILKVLEEASEAIVVTLGGEIIGDSSVLRRIL